MNYNFFDSKNTDNSHNISRDMIKNLKNASENLINISNDKNAILILSNGDFWFANYLGQKRTIIGTIHNVSGMFDVQELNMASSLHKILVFHNNIKFDLFIQNLQQYRALNNKQNIDSKNYDLINFDEKTDTEYCNNFISNFIIDNLTEANKLELNIQNNDNLTILYDIDINDIILSINLHNYINTPLHACIYCFDSNTKEIKTNDLLKIINNYSKIDDINFNFNIFKQNIYVKSSLINNKLSFLSKKKKIGLINFGASDLLIEYFTKLFDVIILPANTSYHSIHLLKLNGMILSDGPANVNLIDGNIVENIKLIINNKIPILGFEFGAQILSIIHNIPIIMSEDTAMIQNIYKIINLKNNIIEIATKNTKFNISITNEYLIENNDIEILYKNIYNNNCEMFIMKKNKIIACNFLLNEMSNNEFIINRFFELLNNKR